MNYPLKTFQTQALEALSSHHHVICIAPTGSGKTRIVTEWINQQRGFRKVVLISPLVALARQHQQTFTGIGLCSAIWSGSTIQSVSTHTQIVIISPEHLESAHRLRTLDQHFRHALWVIDEAHCLWEWGTAFRPSYKQITTILNSRPQLRTLWLTATLPRSAHSYIREQLDYPVFQVGVFSLPSQLEFKGVRIPYFHRKMATLKWISGLTHKKALIFVSSRQNAQELSAFLKLSGLQSQFYHAGLSSEERRAVEQQFKNGSFQILVSTSAFGMGIDLSDLDHVLIWELPFSLLAITQAMGRVARGGKPGWATYFWHPEDLRSLRQQITLPEQLSQLNDLTTWIMADGCKSKLLCDYFSY